MSDTMQIQPQPLPVTISGAEYVNIRKFLGQMSHDAVKPLCDFLDGKQQEAQQIETARARSAETDDSKPVAAKKK